MVEGQLRLSVDVLKVVAEMLRGRLGCGCARIETY